MSDFLTSLAQTALGSSMLVQPRLASRFEATATDEVSNAEVTTDSSPSQPKTLPPEGRTLLTSHHQEERETTQPPQPRDNLVFREPITGHSVEHEPNRDVIIPNSHLSPILGSPTQVQALVQDLPFNQAPVTKQSELTHPKSSLISHEPGEKESLREVHTQHHTETRLKAVAKEKSLPIVQREMVNLELPETPLLQPAITPSILKPEGKVMQTSTPTVQVTIGRLEIRTPPQQKTVQHASKPTGMMSLEEYRRKRGLE